MFFCSRYRDIYSTGPFFAFVLRQQQQHEHDDNKTIYNSTDRLALSFGDPEYRCTTLVDKWFKREWMGVGDDDGAEGVLE